MGVSWIPNYNMFKNTERVIGRTNFTLWLSVAKAGNGLHCWYDLSDVMLTIPSQVLAAWIPYHGCECPIWTHYQRIMLGDLFISTLMIKYLIRPWKVWKFREPRLFWGLIDHHVPRVIEDHWGVYIMLDLQTPNLITLIIVDPKTWAPMGTILLGPPLPTLLFLSCLLHGHQGCICLHQGAIIWGGA